LVQLTQVDLVGADARELAGMQECFETGHSVVLPQLLSEPLLERLIEAVERAEFYQNPHHDERQQRFGLDLTVRENEVALHLIHFLLNNRKLFRVIENITGCRSIGSFAGRIYRNLPGEDHQLDWHDDTDRPERIVGISINLSGRQCRGGIFQLRETATRRIVSEVPSNRAGDAHLFRISSGLQHRVTRVEGEVARTSAAGWFLSEPDRATALRMLTRSVL